MIEDFVLKEHILFSFLGVRHLDYEKIMVLSENQFAHLYLELMTEYKDKDGWWGVKGTPGCSECNKEISGPENLRRYYGLSLHPECFKKVYENGWIAKGMEKKYFDRVAKLSYNLSDLIEDKLTENDL